MLQFYHGRLTEVEENIRNFKEKKGITNLAVSTQALITQTSTLESSKSQLQIEKKILRDIDSYLDVQGTDTELTYAATLMGDPMLSGIYSNLLQVEAEYRAALKEYSIGHPKVMQISAQLSGLKEQLKEETTKIRSYGEEMAKTGTCPVMTWDQLKKAVEEFSKQNKIQQ